MISIATDNAGPQLSPHSEPLALKNMISTMTHRLAHKAVFEAAVHALQLPFFDMSKSYSKRAPSALEFGGTPNFDPDPPSTNKRGMKGQTARSHAKVLETQNKAAGVTAPTKKPRKQQEKNVKIDDIRACEARLTERIVGSDARMGARFGRLENGLEMLLKGHLGRSATADTQPLIDTDADDDLAALDDVDADAEQLVSSQMEVEEMVTDENGPANEEDSDLPLEVLDWGAPGDGVDLEGQDSMGGQEEVGEQVDMEVQDDMDVEESSQRPKSSSTNNVAVAAMSDHPHDVHTGPHRARPPLVLLLGLVLGSDTHDGATGLDRPRRNDKGAHQDTALAHITAIVARLESALVPATVARVVRRPRTVGVETITRDVDTLVTSPEIAATPAVARGAVLAAPTIEAVSIAAAATGSRKPTPCQECDHSPNPNTANSVWTARTEADPDRTSSAVVALGSYTAPNTHRPNIQAAAGGFGGG
ncbi:hypothetical protein C8R46DRAFT_1035839 [Mycena filopes]|nr:hypothetical protein C8R46DRAFT_1035839 [Mycena filopes]